MSVTKDGDTGRWMSQIRVTDWTGKSYQEILSLYYPGTTLGPAPR